MSKQYKFLNVEVRYRASKMAQVAKPPVPEALSSSPGTHIGGTGEPIPWELSTDLCTQMASAQVPTHTENISS